ncbi:MAG: hypothetical protein M1821_007683 [Bathelium mastoideum]|nr:MAG: hypothetical protein M1821_007683 [Bathelium mastoideum]
MSIATELYHDVDTLVQLEDVRATLYDGKAQENVSQAGSPLVRVVWKPDIGLFDHGVNEKPERNGIMGALDLIAHKKPDLRICRVGNDIVAASCLEVLCHTSAMRRFRSFTSIRMDRVKEFLCRDWMQQSVDASFATDERKLGTADVFDLIILFDAGTSHFRPGVMGYLELLSNYVAPDAMIAWALPVKDHSSPLIDGSDLARGLISSPRNGMAIAVYPVSSQDTVRAKETRLRYTLLYRDNDSQAVKRIQIDLEEKHGIQAVPLCLSQVTSETLLPHSKVISILELWQPLLAELHEKDNSRLKILTDNASSILWITGGDLVNGRNPNLSLVLGLSRAVMLEQPSIQFSVLDVDDVVQGAQPDLTNLGAILKYLDEDADPDLEFMQVGGILHSSRWAPESTLGDLFLSKQNETKHDLELQKSGRCRLSITHRGQLDGIHFAPFSVPAEKLPAGYIEIRVEAVGMNAKDIYVLTGRVDTKNVTCSGEYTGIVVKTGPNVTKFTEGDRVVVVGPGHFGTFEQVPEWACEQLLPNESFTVLSTVPIVYATAMYALQHCAQLQSGETLLIHSATGGLGLAVIQLAQSIGAKVFATVSTEEKKDFLTKNYGISRNNIFDSRSVSFLPKLMSATSGRGVDVVVNSLAGELLHESWHACADFGRFIELGKYDILDKGMLEMDVFARNVSFTAFDLSSLYYSEKVAHHRLWHRLLEESLSFWRALPDEARIPLQVFDVGQIEQAFRHFMSTNRIGKVAVSFEDPHTQIKVLPPRHETRFSARKTYLMVGCLGGLGRSIAKWMVERGARSSVFLGRSGLKNSAAQDLINTLEGYGVSTRVVKGSVSKYDDVEAMIEQAEHPIGGVVQAAMGLQESLWTQMSSESWHCAIEPKVKGTWNLHKALRVNDRDRDMDFFLMTSSVSGTVGTATEANYCSGNAFLDSFARYRRSLGLPAISIGLGMISEVGYLHEHPEIEALIVRKGIRAIDEDSMLQIIDLALSHDSRGDTYGDATTSEVYDRGSLGHLLTGVEVIGLQEQRTRGFEGDSHFLHDPRAVLFAAAFDRSSLVDEANGIRKGAGDVQDQITDALQASDDPLVMELVKTLVARKIANLILMKPEDLKPESKFSEFGIDSMLAAEFRGYIFRELHVDVPFMTLLDKGTSVNSLVELIVNNMKEKQAGK